jgi:hypothetical protein
MKIMQIKLSPFRIARILFLAFKSICMLVAVLTVACLALSVLLMIGFCSYVLLGGWTGVAFYITFLIGLAFLYQHT